MFNGNIEKSGNEDKKLYYKKQLSKDFYSIALLLLVIIAPANLMPAFDRARVMVVPIVSIVIATSMLRNYFKIRKYSKE